jgi:hypothetical protein
VTAVGIPERYVRLCLRVGRHIDGFIDAFIGPSEWEQSVAADEPVDPRRLRDEAQILLDGLGDADLEEERRRWLRGQLEALECITARLSGADIAWTDEVERCLGVRPTRRDTKVFEGVHRRLDAALPGSGTVRERYIAWDENNAVPREKLVPAPERLKEVVGPRAHALAPMPAEESVSYEIVSNNRGSPTTGTRGSTAAALRSMRTSRSPSVSWSTSPHTRRTPVTTPSGRRRRRTSIGTSVVWRRAS